MRSTAGITRWGRIAALLAAGIALAPGPADAKQIASAPASAPIAVDLSAPVILDAGFEPPTYNHQGVQVGRLWIRLAAPRGPAPDYVLEPVAGHAPRAMPWGRVLEAVDNHIVFTLQTATEPAGSEPFLFGFRVRAASEGKRGAASDPAWISFAATDPVPERTLPRSDQVLFVLLVLGLGFVWHWYKREESAEGKIRLAALGALISVIFLSVTSAMPWLGLDGAADSGRVSCLLGQEASCLFRAGSPVVGATDASMPAVAYELQRWQCASAALRMGQVTALALLLPALVWLLVDPRHRAAQAATAVGASVGGFVFLVAMLYRHSTPSWLDADIYWTADIALVTSSHIVVAAILVVRQSFALLSPPQAIPRAAVRYR